MVLLVQLSGLQHLQMERVAKERAEKRHESFFPVRVSAFMRILFRSDTGIRGRVVFVAAQLQELAIHQPQAARAAAAAVDGREHGVHVEVVPRQVVDRVRLRAVFLKALPEAARGGELRFGRGRRVETAAQFRTAAHGALHGVDEQHRQRGNEQKKRLIHGWPAATCPAGTLR